MKHKRKYYKVDDFGYVLFKGEYVGNAVNDFNEYLDDLEIEENELMELGNDQLEDDDQQI